ncbi:hypothetical protein SAMN05421781_2269 [Marinococcus luteus]|uniref:Uncharacterized protein n=1 Tax=Marinococcus luteus TaxID=1122204 RepID=A0A1H2W5G6_9BACI|nr:hypothetical protein [Marinococcus luteus]SDW75830.1 hypothetical protein SAMN05421781_2269 [Marinococcus luteus]
MNARIADIGHYANLVTEESFTDPEAEERMLDTFNDYIQTHDKVVSMEEDLQQEVSYFKISRKYCLRAENP